MTYLIKVPFETATPLRSTDPDIRSISSLPGYRALHGLGGGRRYELEFEVEGGSIRDAADAAEEVLVDYLSALALYHPQVLATVSPALKPV